MPFAHGYCLLWDAKLLGVQLVSDLAIAVAYYAIPVLLLAVREQLESYVGRHVLLLFSLFIIACGTTHVMDIIVVFTPVYWTQSCVKVITALLSVATGTELIRMRRLLLEREGS